LSPTLDREETHFSWLRETLPGVGRLFPPLFLPLRPSDVSKSLIPQYRPAFLEGNPTLLTYGALDPVFLKALVVVDAEVSSYSLPYSF